MQLKSFLVAVICLTPVFSSSVFAETIVIPKIYAVPTAAPALNDNDKAYLCILLNVPEAACSSVHFTISSAGIFGSQGIIQHGIDIRIKQDNKQCAGTVWKTLQRDNMWVLSAPTSLHGFPYSCDFVEAK